MALLGMRTTILLALFFIGGSLGQTTPSTLSSFQCTAKDFRVNGPGLVLNQPCPCINTFDAQVLFNVSNNAASDRNCITFYLCDRSTSSGDPGYVVNFNDTIPGKATSLAVGTIKGLACPASSEGIVCYGDTDCSGCCDTITWRVPGQDPTCNVSVTQIKSKCRHQQICLAFRSANATCADNTDSCSVPCGGTTSLRVCTTGLNTSRPVSISVIGPSGQTVYTNAAGSLDTNGCAILTGVTAPETGSYNVTVTGTAINDGTCPVSDTVHITVGSISLALSAFNQTNCAGQGYFTATASGGTAPYNITFVTPVSGPVACQTSSTGRCESNLILFFGDNACHTATANVVDKNGCTATASRSFSQCAVVTTTPLASCAP